MAIVPREKAGSPPGVWDANTGEPGSVYFDGAAKSLLDPRDFPIGCFFELDTDIYHFEQEDCGGGPFPENGDDTSQMVERWYEPFDSAASWTGNHSLLVVGPDPSDPENAVILMQELGDASFFRDIEWPGDALVMTFDYLFLEPRGSESLTVYVDDQIVYYDNADTTLATDAFTSSGAVYVGDVAGTTARLNFVLRTDGELAGAVVLDNVRVFALPKVPTEGPPAEAIDPLDIRPVPPP
jgi:hypothetical protein